MNLDESRKADLQEALKKIPTNVKLYVVVGAERYEITQVNMIGPDTAEIRVYKE